MFEQSSSLLNAIGSASVHDLCSAAGISVPHFIDRIYGVDAEAEPLTPTSILSANPVKVKVKVKAKAPVKAKAKAPVKAKAKAPVKAKAKAPVRSTAIGSVRILGALPGTEEQISIKIHRSRADVSVALKRMLDAKELTVSLTSPFIYQKSTQTTDSSG